MSSPTQLRPVVAATGVDLSAGSRIVVATPPDDGRGQRASPNSIRFRFPSVPTAAERAVSPAATAAAPAAPAGLGAATEDRHNAVVYWDVDNVMPDKGCDAIAMIRAVYMWLEAEHGVRVRDQQA